MVKPINPTYPKPGTKVNCRRCTFNYEMRRRGLDTKATLSLRATGQEITGVTQAIGGTHKSYESGWGQKKIGDGSFDSKSSKEKSHEIFDRLNKEPNGSRGEIGFGWQFGGGHSIAYEVINHKAVLIDAQSGHMFRDADGFDSFGSSVGIREVAYTRLDNAKLNEQFLRRWATNVD